MTMSLKTKRGESHKRSAVSICRERPWLRTNGFSKCILLLVMILLIQRKDCVVMSFSLILPSSMQNKNKPRTPPVVGISSGYFVFNRDSGTPLYASSGKTQQQRQPPQQQRLPTKENKQETGQPPRNETSQQQNNVHAKFESRLSEMHERNNRGDKLTQSYCDSVLAYCVASNEWDSVLDVLEVMKQQGFTQERSTYRRCLKECHEAGNGASAKEILTAMRQAGVPTNSIDVSLVVAAMCRNEKTERGWWKTALLLLRKTAQEEQERFLQSDEHDSPDVVAVEAYDAVLTCMVKERQWKEALRLLNQMEQGMIKQPPQDNNKTVAFHPAPVLSTYHAVIENCVASLQAEQAVQVLLSMPKKGVQPNVYTFEQVIVALSKRQQWRRAIQLLDIMDDLKIPQTTFTYNTVIASCAKAREVGTARNLLVKMKKRGIRPNVVSFNSLMTACAGTARWKDALSLLGQCSRQPDIEPDIITYTNAIRACGRGGNTKRALSLLQVVKDKGLPLDVYCYTAVIDACAKGKMWRRALDLLDEMRQTGITPNEVTYSVAIAACGNGGQWERALELLYQMREKGMKINVITYNAAITALSKASRFNVKQSSRMHAPMRFSGSGSYSEEGTAAPDVDEEQLWVRALELLKQMKDDGIEPDGFSYSAAISACGSGGRWKEALDLIQTMQKGGPKTRPNKIAYTSAISACGRAGEWETATHLFSEMKNEGLQPDKVAYNALVSALRVSNMPDKAFEIWEEMCGKREPSLSVKARAAADASMSPDIITVTDVIGTLCRSEGKVNVDRVDKVFAEAVRRGIVLRAGSLDSLWETDMSGMSFPVARAACRYIVKQVLEASRTGGEIRDISLLTGVGKGHRLTQGGSGKNGKDDDDKQTDGQSTQRIATPGTTALREYVRQVLRKDLDPPLYSTIPKFQQGTVLVTKDMLRKWIDAQPKQ